MIENPHMLPKVRSQDLMDSAMIRERYPHAFWEQLFKAHAETLSRWVALGLIFGTDWEIV